MRDKLKLAFSCILFVSGFLAFYLLHAVPESWRLLILCLGVLSSVVVFRFTERGRGVHHFFLESIHEIKKMVWPSRQETLQVALAVAAITVLMALYLWLVDKSVEWIIYEVILGWRS